MVSLVPDVLARIVDAKQSGVARLRELRPELERAAAARRPRDFRAALAASPPAVIAEIKKASPSRGVLAEDFRPAETARAYERGGAAALSVLTDEPFFQGRLEDMVAARAAVSLPVLRKDFTLGEVHILEAAAHGADAILLIAALLDAGDLRRLREFAAGLGVAALVEVHDERELFAAAESGADVIGVNNRDLRTFRVSLETSLRLAERIPPTAVRVSESGIHTAEDVRKLRDAGFQAFLVGEHLMKSPDPARAVELLRQ